MKNPNMKNYIVVHPNGEYLAYTNKGHIRTTRFKALARRYFHKMAKEKAKSFIGGKVERVG